RKRETNRCQTDNMPVGDNYYEMRSKSRGECWKLTPHSITTASGMLYLRSNNALGATCSPAHSTLIAVGSKRNGRYAKERKELRFACPCRSKDPRKAMMLRTKRPNCKRITHSGFERIGLYSRKLRAKKYTFRQ